MSITRNAMATQIADKAGLSRETVREILSTLLDGIAGELEKTGRVEWRGFGVFTVKSLPPTRKRNPRTGESVMVPARKKVVFRTGKLTFERLNGKSGKTVPPTGRKRRDKAS
jgi:nucleoid DNA-binding protein